MYCFKTARLRHTWKYRSHWAADGCITNISTQLRGSHREDVDLTSHLRCKKNQGIIEKLFGGEQKGNWDRLFYWMCIQKIGQCLVLTSVSKNSASLEAKSNDKSIPGDRIASSCSGVNRENMVQKNLHNKEINSPRYFPKKNRDKWVKWGFYCSQWKKRWRNEVSFLAHI